jgi:hypothetical protein
MNELIVIFVIIVTLAIGYLLVYPKLAGNDVRKMVWLDVALTLIPLMISALLFWQSDPAFSLIFFSTNWFVFTLVTLAIIEIPVLILYLKARGLSREYWKLMVSSPTWSGRPAREKVERALDDVRWEGLRTSGSKVLLLISSNFVLIVGTIALFLMDDTPWTAFSLIQIALIFISWFLLRKSVRLIADAPEEFLDERLVQARNRAYVPAYQLLGGLILSALTALLVFAIVADFSRDSDGFTYELTFTWTQLQGVFWLFCGYALMLPSMAVILQDLSTRTPVASTK